VIRATIVSLVVHSLSRDALFYENMHELDLWLNSLPCTRRSPEAEAPDETPLTNEDDSVVKFLDDCIQRTIKAPHKYLEYLHNLVPSDAQPGDMESHPSPLLIMVIEQLGYNVENKLLSASDVLAIVSFVRKVLCRLSSELRNLRFLRLLTEKIDENLSPERLFPQQSCMTWAIRRQVKILRFSLRHPPSPQSQPPMGTNAAVQEFLDQVEQMPIREYF
jgi:nucleolar pre-ribosomal-associated protein 1